jgi:hypothetical protein
MKLFYGASPSPSAPKFEDGEHHIFTGLWTVLVAPVMMGSSLFRPWLGWAGIAAAAGILVGTLEQAGFAPAADVVVVGYVLWSIWLVVTGVFLLGAGARPAGA